MLDLQILSNKDLGDVRVAYKDNEPLFCLSDVCKILELTNPSMVKDAILREFEISKLNLGVIESTNNRRLEVSFIDEAQLYYVLNNSRSKNAKPFRMWVNKEVLPSIRKNGSYSFDIPKTYAEALLEAGRLALENERLQALQIENKPKIEAFDTLMETKDLIDFLEFSKVVKTGRNKLFKHLRDINILMENNIPYQRYMDKGYFKCIEQTFKSAGKVKINIKTMITAKGQDWLIKKLKVSK